MDEVIVKAENLTKKYRKHTALDDFSTEIKRGHIYGLIGPNGAGKTTFMRILAGLTEQTSGKIFLFGETKEKKRAMAGFLVEQPFLDGGMTAYENLYLQRLITGTADVKRIDTILEWVGLTEVKKKKVKEFSLGMRQRLGIGMALLSDPELLVLDEPVNGLDPEGIIDIRNLLLRLNHENHMTIIISSHILSELYLLATDYIFIKNGKKVDEISAIELENHTRSYVEIITDDAAKAAVTLEKKLGFTDYKVCRDDSIYLYEGLDNVGDISDALFNQGLKVMGLNIRHESLEDYYLQIMGDERGGKE